MVENFKFSIIIPVYNVEDYLDETVESIINQDIGFEDNVQLILVDDGSTDNSREIALKYNEIYPKNVIVVSKENGGQSSARNLGLKYAEGEYVNFLDSDDKLTLNTLREVYSFFKNHDVNIIAIPLMYFGRRAGDHYLNGKFERDTIVDVYKDYSYPQLSIPSCFIKTSLFDGFYFDERFNIGEDAVLINKLLVDEGKIAFLNDAEYLYRKRFDDSSTLDSSSLKKEFYLDKCKFFYIELIDYCLSKLNRVPKFIQYVIAHDMQWYYIEVDILEILSKEEYDQFMEEIRYVLSFIDDEIILKHEYLSSYIRTFFIYLKNNDFHVEVNPDRNHVLLKSDDFTISKFHKRKVYIDIVELNNSFLNISGLLLSNCKSDVLSIDAIKKIDEDNIETFKSERVEYKTTKRHTVTCLNIPWEFYYTFDIKIPITDENCKISLNVNYAENGNEVTFRPRLQLKKYCDLTEYSNYFVKDNKIVLFRDNAFHVLEYSSKFHLKLEALSIFNIITSLEVHDAYAIFIHILYLITFPFWKNRKIWLFMDRPAIADDNAMHLFKYASSQEDSIEKYFIVDKKSEDYKKMLKISPNVINYGSLKHKLLYLYAEKIMSSHVDHQWVNPFYYDGNFFAGLTTIKLYFLQHGVTKDDVSGWLRKFYHNFGLFLTVSDFERDSIINGNYNYSEEIVQLFGFPRYDNLDNKNSEKVILFVPTWRSYLRTETQFLNSSYYKRITSFFNNEKLINFLKDKGFKIVFKPHFNLLEYLDLFDIPDEIVVSTDTPYQELFNNASLMITDYSSVFFDFAYIKKPVIYYQSDDYHYKHGYFDYETMGFGDIIQTEDELIDKIIEYIDNNCKMEDKYVERVDKFFKYTDKNNSKRVYEWLLSN